MSDIIFTLILKQKEMSEVEKISLGGKIWRLNQVDEGASLRLSETYDLPISLANILIARDVKFDETESFLHPKIKNLMPDPYVLKDMQKAVERVSAAIRNGEKIAVIGDYDVDGATSTSILKKFFSHFGIEPLIHIPSREEGYGPSDAAFREFENEKAKLVITIDCGTTAFDVLNRAAENGFDVIVIDHHEAEVVLPEVFAIVNPKRLDEENQYKYLQYMSAVGVGFMFLVALNRDLRLKKVYEKIPEPDLFKLLDLVALGTVCDVVPLKGLNRAYVKQGLKVLSEMENIGLKNLMAASGVSGVPDSHTLGFVLGPRINACGRVGNADLENVLLCSEDELEAKSLAEKFNRFNEERKEIEKYVLLQAIEQIEKQPQEYPIAFVAGNDWHQGVIGIVAGKLRERYNVPAFVMSTEADEVKGSARSIDGLDLGALIISAKEKGVITGGGGHLMAAGFSLKQEQIAEFKKFVGEYVNEKLGKEKIAAVLPIDSVLSLNALNYELCEKINLLEPYGSGNPEPMFMFKNVGISKPQIIGSGHIKCFLTSVSGASVKAVCFNCVDSEIGKTLLNHKGEVFDVAGYVKTDNWMGRKNVQIVINDIARGE